VNGEEGVEDGQGEGVSWEFELVRVCEDGDEGEEEDEGA